MVIWQKGSTFAGKLQKNGNIMAKKTAKQSNPKRVAYEKKQEKEGTKVVMWIIGVLIVLGIFYAIWSSWMVA